MRRRFSLSTKRFTRRGRGFGGAYFGETLPVTFPTVPLRARIYIALGADLSASWLSWNWLDITSRVRVDLGVRLTVGRRDQFSIVSPSRATLKLDNADGYLSRRNPASPYYGLLTKNTPIWVQLNPGSGFADRYHGFVNDWPTRWADPSGADTTVTIECSGVLRRLVQGRRLKSAMFRSMSGVAAGDYVPFQYWPLEDGADTDFASSGLAGGVTMTPSGTIAWASDTVLTGSEALPAVAASGFLSATIPAYTSGGQWVFQFLHKLTTAPSSAGVDIAEITVSGGFHSRYVVNANTEFGGSIEVRATIASTGTVDTIPGIITETWDVWRMITVWARQDGADVFYGINHTDGLGADAVPNEVNAASSATLGTVTGIRLLGAAGTTFGHAAFFTDANFDISTDTLDNAAAMYGYTGEQAHVRMARLCREEGIPFLCTGAPSAAMGPQPAGTLLEVLRDAESTDQGVMFEREFGIGYKTLAEFYNQPVSLALDFDQRHIMGPPAPSDDDQFTRNQWTVSRSGGATGVVAEQTTGTMGTGPGGPGLWADAITENVQTDLQLIQHASWRVHIGTVDEDRWPNVPLKMHGSPELIPAWLAMPFGGRLTLANPPPQMAPDTIDALLDGHAEHFDEVSWHVLANTSPASPYSVAVLDDGSLGRLDSATSTLAADFTDTATTFTVTTTNTADLWTTDSAEFPLDILIAGERITLSSISGATSPQTFNVSARSVNGVVKAHTAGAQVHVYQPATLAL